jgi:nitrogen fixation NifU-like protein
MVVDAASLYRQMVIDHGRSPRHFGPLASCNCRSAGHNRVCGDKLEVFLQVDSDTIHAASFEGAGCAIMMASASLMMEQLQGCTCTQAHRLLDCFLRMMRTHPASAHPQQTPSAEDATDDCAEELGPLTHFAQVRAFPTRIKCATLPWEALAAALRQDPQTISTET